MKKDFGKICDSDLITLLKSDKSESEPAFAELYSRYSQRVYAYCLRVTGHSDDAKDIFQESFVKFFNTAKDTKSKKIENVPAFVIVIARNIYLNYKRDKIVTYDIEDYNLSTNDVVNEKNELQQVISSAIELLDFEYREAFILRQYQGLSYSEISEITGETIPTIKNRVWRAKEKLKTILQPYLQNVM